MCNCCSFCCCSCCRFSCYCCPTLRCVCFFFKATQNSFQASATARQVQQQASPKLHPKLPLSHLPHDPPPSLLPPAVPHLVYVLLLPCTFAASPVHSRWHAHSERLRPAARSCICEQVATAFSTCKGGAAGVGAGWRGVWQSIRLSGSCQPCCRCLCSLLPHFGGCCEWFPVTCVGVKQQKHTCPAIKTPFPSHSLPLSA